MTCVDDLRLQEHCHQSTALQLPRSRGGFSPCAVGTGTGKSAVTLFTSTALMPTAPRDRRSMPAQRNAPAQRVLE
jgi:hypothetical protein